MSIITEVIESTKAIIQGMGVTLSYIPKRKWTVEYPDQPVTMQPRYRGQHLLHVDELGREKCVACYLCAAACPSECIYIVAADDPRPAEERTGVDERVDAPRRRSDGARNVCSVTLTIQVAVIDNVEILCCPAAKCGMGYSNTRIDHISVNVRRVGSIRISCVHREWPLIYAIEAPSR